MDHDFTTYVLTAMAGTISALWFRMGRMQTRLDELIRAEAACQAKLDTIKVTLDRKHEENQQAIASLYCVKEKS